MTVYSLNEINAMCKKAARGAGYPWGLAEEAGRAARWLCAHGLDGTGALLELLQEVDHSSCAVTQGCHLLDKIDLGVFEKPIDLHSIRCPQLLAAFTGQAACILAQPLAITWQSYAITVGPNGASQKGTFTSTLAQTVRIEPTSDAPISKICDGIEVKDEVWDALGILAHKTYAPATEASRLKGAGAGLSDQD